MRKRPAIVAVCVVLVGLLGGLSYVREVRVLELDMGSVDSKVEHLLDHNTGRENLTKKWDLSYRMVMVESYGTYCNPHIRFWTRRNYETLCQFTEIVGAYEPALRELIFFPENARPEHMDQLRTLRAHLKEAGWDGSVQLP